MRILGEGEGGCFPPALASLGHSKAHLVCCALARCAVSYRSSYLSDYMSYDVQLLRIEAATMTAVEIKER